MKFAIVDHVSVQAQPGLKGICPGCGGTVLAKCGTERLHHWAHQTIKACDIWYEPETEWHRAWKNNFPSEWQEIFLPDPQTGEKHMADVRTSHGVVLEFQHSNIDPKERISREDFYRNMVWVVDGTRLKRDFPRFVKARKDLRVLAHGIFWVNFVDECFPSAWTKSAVPVVFDFRGVEPINDTKDIRHDLYCLFPGLIGMDSVLAVLSRKAFIDAIMDGKLTIWTKTVMAQLNQQRDDAFRKRQNEMITQAYNKARPFRRGRRL